MPENLQSNRAANLHSKLRLRNKKGRQREPGGRGVSRKVSKEGRERGKSWECVLKVVQDRQMLQRSFAIILDKAKYAK